MTEKLYRSGKEKMLAGVCGGLAEYFSVDVTLIRLITLLTFFMGGMGFLAYLVAWVIMPLNPAHQDGQYRYNATNVETIINEAFSDIKSEFKANSHNGPRRFGNENRTKLAGAILVILGIIFLLNQWFPFWFDFGKMWPLILILIGAAIIWRRD